MIINVYLSSCKVPIIYYILKKIQFSLHTKKKDQISNFMKIRLVGAKLFNVDAWTDRHDTASIFPPMPHMSLWTLWSSLLGMAEV